MTVVLTRTIHRWVIAGAGLATVGSLITGSAQGAITSIAPSGTGATASLAVIHRSSAAMGLYPASYSVRAMSVAVPVRRSDCPHRFASKSFNLCYAVKYVKWKFRWNRLQFLALRLLWAKESGWNERAGNSRSGAYGLPQALPGRKMAKYGKDWRTNPMTQVKWGAAYIKGRYGSPARAWSHFKRHRWY